MKGTDQKGSSEPHEVKQLLHDIRTYEMSCGNYMIAKDPKVELASKKLERSIAVNKTIKTGEMINETDIHMISPGDGYKWEDRNKFIGQRATKDIEINTLLTNDMI